MRNALVLAQAFLLMSLALAAGGDSPSTAEERAIDAIAKAGGKAAIDPKLAPTARVEAEFDSATDATLIALAKQPQLGGLEILDATKCTAKGFAALKSLPHLRKLVLAKSNPKAAGARAIAQCKELRHLGLVESGLTDLELPLLKDLTKLEHLALSNNPKITDRGMATIQKFERLQALYLANTALTDKGLAELKGLDGLRTLNVVNTKVTAEAAEQFVDEMPNLRGIRR